MTIPQLSQNNLQQHNNLEPSSISLARVNNSNNASITRAVNSVLSTAEEAPRTEPTTYLVPPNKTRVNADVRSVLFISRININERKAEVRRANAYMKAIREAKALERFDRQCFELVRSGWVFDNVVRKLEFED